MLSSLFVIFLLNFGGVCNQETSCACEGTSRRHLLIKSVFHQFFRTDLQQCPIRHEDNISVEHKNEPVKGMVMVPAGKYQVGTDDMIIETDKEGPKRMVQLNSFYIDTYEVSNRDFNKFVKSTNYKTEAEVFGDSFVFVLFLNNTVKENLEDFRVVQAPWWYKVDGANWRHPHGPDSDIAGNKTQYFNR